MYEEFYDEKQSAVLVTWVITENTVQGKVQVKAYLITHSFEDLARVVKDSSTSGKLNLRLLFALTNPDNIYYGYQGKHLYKGSQYKKGCISQISSNLHNKLWRLKTILNRFCEAPRTRYQCVKTCLLGIGCVKSWFSDIILCCHEENTLQGLLSAHVDNFCLAGPDLFLKIILGYARKCISPVKKNKQKFKYLGLNALNTLNIMQNLC